MRPELSVAAPTLDAEGPFLIEAQSALEHVLRKAQAAGAPNAAAALRLTARFLAYAVAQQDQATRTAPRATMC